LKKLEADRIYFIHTIIVSLAFSTIFTVSQVYRVLTVGLDPLQLVLVGTTLELSAFIFEIPTGVMADIYNRRPSTILGVSLTGLSFLIEGTFPVFSAVLVAQVVWGLGWTFSSGAHEAWIADEIGPDRVAPVFLRGTTYGQVTGLLAIPLGVILGRVALNLPFLVGGGLFLFLGLFLVLFMPEIGFKSRPKQERESWKTMASTLKEGIGLIRARPALLSFMLVAIFLGLYSEGFDRLNEAHLLTNFSLPTYGDLDVVVWFGILRAGGMVFAIGFTELARRKLDFSDDKKLVYALQTAYGLVVVGLLIFALTRQFEIAIAAIWLVNAMRATAGPLNAAWINQHIHSSVRATVLSTTNQMDALGQLIGGPITGAIGSLRSIRAALVTSGFLLLPVLPLYRRSMRESGTTEEELLVDS
jgi:DHA3 family tetracycline resistance protein-like MFS transporter